MPIDSVRSIAVRTLLHPEVAVDMYALSRFQKYRRLSPKRQLAQRTGTFYPFFMADGGRVRHGSEFQVAVGGHGLLLRNPAHGYERGDDPESLDYLQGGLQGIG